MPDRLDDDQIRARLDQLRVLPVTYSTECSIQALSELLDLRTRLAKAETDLIFVMDERDEAARHWTLQADLCTRTRAELAEERADHEQTKTSLIRLLHSCPEWEGCEGANPERCCVCRRKMG